MHRLLIFILFFFTISVSLKSQGTFEIVGQVVDDKGKPLDLVSVVVDGMAGGSITNPNGNFKLKVKVKFPVVLVFSRIGYEKKELALNKNDEHILKVVLVHKTESIETIEVKGKNNDRQSFTKIDSKIASKLPDASGGGIESLVKTQLGVSSSNELSSQYRVRGGNFDENLVYVNDIEIYRPFLVRSGQQEGLSFVNPEMVSDIHFSAGGFDARYGDKMSSVLDIRYKQPTSFGGSASASMLGAGAHIQGISKNKKLSHTSGVRYKTNKYLIGNSDVSGDYKPNFFDFQTYITYRINDKWRVNFLGNVSRNNYNFKPVDRLTTFGSINELKQLKIYFEGKEDDLFMTGFGAVSLDFAPNNDNSFKFITSAYRTSEDESFDIMGQYWLQDLGEQLSDGSFFYPEGTGIGVGTYIEHARNYLFGEIINLAVRGNHRINTNKIEWEVKYQHERFSDIINEWEMRDSAGYSLPITQTELVLAYSYNAENDIKTNRITSFIQNNKSFDWNKADAELSFGVRTNYWDFNKEFLFSPRVNLLIRPDWKRDYSFRFATGLYYQSPFYKEYRSQGEGINYNVKAQQSIHFVTGFDYYFKTWARPFKFTTELYYKKMSSLNPYQIDNVRIRYSAKNNAKGYVAGLDMKINGEFIEGVESWASLSIMKTEEDLNNDSYINSKTGNIVYPGYIPRPSDQRFNFSLMLQDYLQNNPSFKVNLNFIYGSGLPFGPPRSERYKAVNRMPAYRRLDIGFSKEITGSQFKNDKSEAALKSVWIGLEVFNLFNIDNTVSHFWVTDIQNRQYAVPNYLTSRRINLKLVTRF